MDALFVYGTLQDPQVQERVFGRVVAGLPDMLDGYRKGEITINGNVYFIAVEDAAGAIAGLVLEITPAELVEVDTYEGDDYRRVRVWLRSGREAWVYCA
jgi:gamma-glutamylcyclotransferase (GGCT)/AIG2-like uncharacterized protein YtfP